MAYIKTTEQIKKIKEGGKILGQIMQQLIEEVKPGISTGSINKLAKELVYKNNGEPSFEGYGGSVDELPFPCVICASINDQIVHAPARYDVFLQAGDIFSIDIGMKYKGCYTDMAKTVPVGKIKNDAKKLLRVTKKTLDLAIEQVKPGNTVADLGRAIETCAHKNGFSVVRDLVGHGVGTAVHEEPKIPNFVIPENERIILEPGMVIAIEPMLTMGSYEIIVADDGWTISTRDGSLSAHFEHTIIVTKDGNEIATK